MNAELLDILVEAVLKLCLTYIIQENKGIEFKAVLSPWILTWNIFLKDWEEQGSILARYYVFFEFCTSLNIVIITYVFLFLQ